MPQSKRARLARPFLKWMLSSLLRPVQCDRQAGLLAISRGAGDDAGFDGLVDRGQGVGQRLARFGFFTGDDRVAEAFLHAAKA